MVGKVRGTYRKLTKEEAANGEFDPRGLRIARVAQWTGIVLLVRQLIIDIAAGCGQSTKLIVNQRQELVRRSSVSARSQLQEPRHIGHVSPLRPIFLAQICRNLPQIVA
jgi:hypothetical protein